MWCFAYQYSICVLTILTIGLYLILMKKQSKPDVNEAASALGKRSAEVRQKQWGKKEFLKKMREWGKLGGRPKKETGKSKQRKEKA